jgi:hypothetical protein
MTEKQSAAQAAPNQGECLCGARVVWAELPLLGYMFCPPADQTSEQSVPTGTPHLAEALEIRTCASCKTTISQVVGAYVLEAHVRAIPDKVQRSAALTLISIAADRAERAHLLAVTRHASIGREAVHHAIDESDVELFRCTHGHTLSEPCDGCAVEQRAAVGTNERPRARGEPEGRERGGSLTARKGARGT